MDLPRSQTMRDAYASMYENRMTAYTAGESDGKKAMRPSGPSIPKGGKTYTMMGKDGKPLFKKEEVEQIDEYAPLAAMAGKAAGALAGKAATAGASKMGGSVAKAAGSKLGQKAIGAGSNMVANKVASKLSNEEIVLAYINANGLALNEESAKIMAQHMSDELFNEIYQIGQSLLEEAGEEGLGKLDEVMAYQPPPQMPQPPAEVRPVSQQRTQAQQQRANKFQLNPQLARKMGMRVGGDTASVVVDHNTGTVHRQNDGIPRVTNISGPYSSGYTNYDAANPVTNAPDNGGAITGRNIYQDGFGKSQAFVKDLIDMQGFSDSNFADQQAIQNYQNTRPMRGNNYDRQAGGVEQGRYGNRLSPVRGQYQSVPQRGQGAMNPR